MLKPVRAVAVLAVGALALAACGGGDDGGSDETGKTLVISSDLPLQGASADAAKAMNDAIKLYLKQVDHKAGPYKIEFKEYDDSTVKGKWDAAACTKNAQDHVANADEVAVMGTYNSGCAQIIIPVLNQEGMLMVSHANTYPGLTKPWDANEPQKYALSGKRSYARVITTDDYQGAAAAKFASEKLGVKRVYVLNDNETYGKGVGKAFADSAAKLGITVIANEAWDRNQPNYSALFNKIKATNPDMVYLAGIYDNNGGQLVKDKVAVLGPNDKVYLMVPDGFTGFPPFQKLKESEGTYLTFAGLSTDEIQKTGGAAKDFLDAFKAEYGVPPSSNYALYAAAAVQVILAAIEKSDGTRADITKQVFTAPGITIPADKSVLGKAIEISPETGDTSAKDVTVEQMQSGSETFVQSQTVE